MGANDTADIDQAGLDFITRWEGLILKVYRDVAGYKTVGVGHLVTKAEDAKYPDGMVITREHAMELLHQDVQQCVQALRKHIKTRLNQNQINALISFAFNCGTGVLSNSGVARAVNADELAFVRPRLLEWSKVRINGVMQTNQGLLNRRKSEAELFERPVAEAEPVLTPDEMQYISSQIDEYGKSLISYAVLACTDEPDDGSSGDTTDRLEA